MRRLKIIINNLQNKSIDSSYFLAPFEKILAQLTGTNNKWLDKNFFLKHVRQTVIKKGRYK